ncbi:sugar phosphate isomerase/epimerase [Pseudomonas frederiksbergensis]
MNHTSPTPAGLRGPGIFLAQFMSAEAPFDTLANIARWAAAQGYKAIQLPTLGTQYIDLARAADSQDYCDELKAVCAQAGVEISELSTHLQGQLVAVHPAFDTLFDDFAPEHLRGQPQARTEWAIDQLKLAARASQRLGLKAHATFSGALLWPYVYPWPQRPSGLVEQGFAELARRWLPILDCFEEAGVDLCYEIHPGEDLHDGASFERFLEAVDHHPRAAILYDREPPAASANGLSGLHRSLPRAHPHVPRQGRRVPARCPFGCLRRLSRLGRSAGPLPIFGRWADRFQIDFQQIDAVRLCRLGGSGMGVLPEGFAAGRRRRRGLHPPAHDQQNPQGV